MRATVPLVQEKLEKLSQYPDYVRFLFEPVEPATAPTRRSAARRPRRSAPSSRGTPRRSRRRCARSRRREGLKPREAFAPIRLAVTGSKVSPGLFESLELLGRDESLARLARPACYGRYRSSESADGDHPGDPERPRPDGRADREGRGADDRERRRRERARWSSGPAVAARVGSRRLRPGQPQPGEPDAEERAAPLVQSIASTPRAPCSSTASTTSPVASRAPASAPASSCARLGGGRRREPENATRSRCGAGTGAGAARRPSRRRRAVGRGRDRLEPRERLREPAPELADLGRVALPRLSFRRHGGILARRRSSTIAAPWTGRGLHPRGRGRRGAAAASAG